MSVGADRGDLPARLAARMTERGRPAPGDRVVVAVSGGLDSTVLLHLLRFGAALPRLDLVVAHFDHRMRPESGDDARWVAELAASWDVPVEVGVATEPLTTEQSARDARYRFLESVRARVGARWILTAHQADDQAETVLFRIARGTGLAGLRGIPARRGVLLRPLLSFWRDELERYAASVGLTSRVDPTNADPRFARNAIRRDLIPGLEAAVAPRARRSLVRLARLAAREEQAWRAVLPELVERAILERTDGRIVVARPVLLGYPPSVRARVMRSLLRRLGCSLDEAGTVAAVAFTSAGASGRGHLLPGGLTLSREFDRFVLASDQVSRADALLEIPAVGSGEGRFEVGGRRLGARWSLDALPRDEAEGPTERETFALPRLIFPLRFRGPRPGDRIRLSYGSKKLKKLMGEARIPLSERPSVPVLVDGAERVLWLPGVVRGAGTEPAPGEPIFHIGIGDEGRA